MDQVRQAKVVDREHARHDFLREGEKLHAKSISIQCTLERHASSFRYLANTLGASIIGREDAATKAILCAVGVLDHLLVRVEGNHQHHGAKGLLQHDAHRVVDIGQDRRREEEAVRALDTMAASAQLGATLNGVLHELFDNLELARHGDGTAIETLAWLAGGGGARAALAQGLDADRDLVTELFVD